jgi:DNA-binding transcriptional ArsR family regulator
VNTNSALPAGNDHAQCVLPDSSGSIEHAEAACQRAEDAEAAAEEAKASLTRAKLAQEAAQRALAALREAGITHLLGDSEAVIVASGQVVQVGCPVSLLSFLLPCSLYQP